MDILTDEQVKKFLQPSSLLTTLEEGFRRDYSRTMVAPTRMQVQLPNGTTFLVMPCYDRFLNAFGVKLVSVGDATGASSRVQADYVLLDPKSRQPLLFMQANYLTNIRTATVSAIATKLLACPDSARLGIFGTGQQAIIHLQVFSELFSFRTVLVCGSDSARSEQFAQRFTMKELPVIATSAEKCAAQSDVICTCTTSRQPLFDGSILKPGTHLNLVGAFQPDAREVDDETVIRSRVIVDTYDGAFAEAGDILVPLKSKVIDREHIAADLHELVSGKKPGRTHPKDITVFKSVGHAYEDLIAAKMIFDSCVVPST